jgi:hypothetical protein
MTMLQEKFAEYCAWNATLGSGTLERIVRFLNVQSNTSQAISATARAEYVKTRLVELNKQASETILQTGLLLKEYRNERYFASDGFESFDQALEAWHNSGLLSFGARQARNLIAVTEMAEKMSLKGEDIERIGISRLREIATVKSVDDQRRLLDSAEDMSVTEVAKEAKRLRDKAAGREHDPLDPVTILLTTTQKQFYLECIETARQVFALEENVPPAAVLVDTILPYFYNDRDKIMTELKETS